MKRLDPIVRVHVREVYEARLSEVAPNSFDDGVLQGTIVIGEEIRLRRPCGPDDFVRDFADACVEREAYIGSISRPAPGRLLAWLDVEVRAR